MTGMDFHERMVLRPLLRAKLSELHTNAFENFFANLMSTAHADFVDVRTAGSLGDQSSDGLGLHDRRLFACYGPEVFDVRRVEKKFWGDLAGALEKRRDEFETFVFVHNEVRGVHPTISSVLGKARDQHPNVSFENYGFSRFHREFYSLSRESAEDLLGFQLPLKEYQVTISTDELAPLLDVLRQSRRSVVDTGSISIPSENKLAFNAFSDDQRQELKREFYLSRRIEEYYKERIDVTERDEVASAFRDEYLRLLEEREDLDSVVFGLEQYILGTAACDLILRRCAMAIIGFFFQQCDIFENPSADWPGTGG